MYDYVYIIYACVKYLNEPPVIIVWVATPGKTSRINLLLIAKCWLMLEIIGPSYFKLIQGL